MARTLPSPCLTSRRLPRRGLPRQRPPLHRAHGGGLTPLRTSDLVLALLGVALLGGLALMAAFALAGGATAP